MRKKILHFVDFSSGKKSILQDNALKDYNQRFFEIFSSEGSPKETRSEDKISKNVDFSFWGYHATIPKHKYEIEKKKFRVRVLAHCAQINQQLKAKYEIGAFDN